MTTFKVPCPSCEAKVLIKNPNLIGTKVECPKCKYRFKVEAPKDETPSEPNKPAAAESGDDAGKKSGKNKKKLIGAVLGVVAVGLLAAGGYAIFGGDGKKPGTTSNTKGGTYVPPGQTPSPGDDPDKDKKDTPPGPVAKVSLVPASDKDPTNLLPGQSVAVYRYDLERLR